MVQDAGLYPIPFFIVGIGAFPAHVVANPRSSHQVAFIGRINKNLSFEDLSAEGFDGNDAASLDRYTVLPVQPFVSHTLYLKYFSLILENIPIHMVLKYQYSFV